MESRAAVERAALVGLGVICGVALHAYSRRAVAKTSEGWTTRWAEVDAANDSISASPVKIVKAFLLAQSRRDLDAVCRLVAEDIIYINEPHPPACTIRGKTMFREAFAASACMRCSEADLSTLKFAQNGGLVFVERVDAFKVNGAWLRIPICGYFNVRHGKIEFWKDYWDYCRYKDFVRNTFSKHAQRSPC